MPPPTPPTPPTPQPADDAALCAEHVERVQHLLLPMIVRYEFGELRSTPEGQAVVKAPPELRPSVAIAALDGSGSGTAAGIVEEVVWSDRWPAELIRALVRVRIDWDPPSAALAIRMVAGTDFDDERVQLVVKASDHVAVGHPGHPEVVDALEALQRSVDAAATHRYRVPEMRARVRAAIARHTPPELLDLSPVATDDTWGPLARQVLEAAHERGVDAGAILHALGASPTASSPTEAWRRAMETALTGPAERSAVRELVELLTEAEVQPERPFVATGNDPVARAAVWALAIGPVELADVALAGRVAERCSRTNGEPHVTEALCGRAAGAAVLVLGDAAGSGRRDQGGPAGGAVVEAAVNELERLWLAVDRGDVLKRVGAALGRTPVEIAARQAEAKKAKEIARRRQADPSPSDRRALLREVIADDLGPRLAAHGFTERTAQTFRRPHSGRTDVVSVSTADAMVQLRFGVHHHPGRAAPAKLGIDGTDIGAELALASSDPIDGGGFQPEELASEWLRHRSAMLAERYARRASRSEDDPLDVLSRLVERFEAHGLPALDRWARPEVAAADLEDDEVPFPHGTLLHDLDAPGTPERQEVAARLRRLAAR